MNIEHLPDVLYPVPPCPPSCLFFKKGGFDMEKEKALEVAIELAKAAISTSSSDFSVYPTDKSGESVADFIEALTKRLTAM